MLSYLKQLLTGATPAAGAPAQDLTRMSLAQRQAYRHEMAYQSIRERLLQLGALPSMVRFQVHALDERCHHFRVDLEVSSAFQIQVNDRVLTLQQIEQALRSHSHLRYGVVLQAVHWQVDASNASFTRERRQGDTAGTPIKSHSPLQKQLYQRYARQNFAPASAQDRRKFSQALWKGQPPPPIRVGQQVYASDFVPLDATPLPAEPDEPGR